MNGINLTYFSTRLIYLAALILGIFTIVFLTLLGIANDAGASTGQVKYSRELIKRIVVTEAQSNSVVPPALALAVAKVESDFQAHVESHAGAIGVMQIMPATARGEFGVGAISLWNPRLNISLGIEYLEKLYRQYDNRWDLALSHYNGGTIKNARPHNYTRKYVSDVMRHWQQFQRSNVVLVLNDQVTESGSRGQVKKYRGAQNTKPQLNQRLAEDYWLIDDPKVEKNWREYLKVADRWLNHDGTGLPADFRDDAIPYGNTISYGRTGDSHLGRTTLKERFRNSLERSERPAEYNGSGRFM